MKLKNTPWKYEAHADGTCEIYATDKRRETGLRWIGAAIDEPTAFAIAALPDTLNRLERLEEAAQAVLDNWESGDGTTRVADLMNNLKKALENE